MVDCLILFSCVVVLFSFADEVFDEFCGGECEVFDFGHDVIPLFGGYFLRYS